MVINMTEEITVRAMSRIDAINAPKFEELLKEAMGDGQNSHIVIDMTDTVYICSIGLRVLLATQKKLHQKDGSMIITGVNPQIMEIFEITGFSGIFTME
ncbi:MAG: STAS domain-containing protein [Lachnospiraceae bacterium]|nr:STAS domain-containing protein [Lachnospiraceae bacterium]